MATAWPLDFWGPTKRLPACVVPVSGLRAGLRSGLGGLRVASTSVQHNRTIYTQWSLLVRFLLRSVLGARDVSEGLGTPGIQLEGNKCVSLRTVLGICSSKAIARSRITQAPSGARGQPHCSEEAQQPRAPSGARQLTFRAPPCWLRVDVLAHPLPPRWPRLVAFRAGRVEASLAAVGAELRFVRQRMLRPGSAELASRSLALVAPPSDQLRPFLHMRCEGG